MAKPGNPTSTLGPRCPSCFSQRTFLVSERLGMQSYFCTDCEHTWDEEGSGQKPRRGREKI